MKFIRIAKLLFLSGLALCFSSCQRRGPKTEKFPNIVLIFTDDQGYGDLGCFGSKDISSPHLDSLAKKGMTFTDFHVAAAVCSPSRAAILTGCYPNRVSLPSVLFPDGAWGSKPNIGLNTQEKTIAELLKEEGYVTAMAGKWHLGHLEEFLPVNQGFDRYFGIPYSNDMNRGKLPLLRDTEICEIEPDQSLLTKRYTEYAVDFINDKAQKSPFFLYLAHTMPHIPIFASDDFRHRSKGGLYGDVIEEIDWSVGQIIEALEKNGVLENTLVIFTSDNGPWLSYGNHGGSSGKLRGGKFDMFEGGFRVPCVMYWPDVIPAGSECNQLVTSMDILPTICEIADAELPEKEIDGSSILPVLEGEKMVMLDERPFFYYSGRQIRAIRKGKWKFMLPQRYGEVTDPGMDGVNGKTESRELAASLFNLDDDLSESKNVISDHADLAKELEMELNSFKSELEDAARPIGLVQDYYFDHKKYTAILDVDYTSRNDRKQMMDIYLQNDNDEPAPLIVHIHGGAFKGGSKGGVMSNCDSLYQAGYVIADLNYRLSGDSVFPAAIYDCKAAIRFLKLNCENYGIDSSRIGLIGESAGGYLVTMLGTTEGLSEFEGLHLGSTGTRASVQAVFNLYGPTDFMEMDKNLPEDCNDPLQHLGVSSPESLFLGCETLEDCPELVEKANPLAYVDGNEPPFAIYHGGKDCIVGPYQSVLLHTLLDNMNIDNDFSIVPDKKHADRYFYLPEFRGIIKEFFDRTLNLEKN